MRNNRPHHPQARGRYFMQRGWQEHPVFPAEPFTAREAWEWLIAEAYWREGRTRAGKFVVPLQRGQLCASVRYLASRWQWKSAKVARFLNRLKTETMIETRSDTGISVITICNYEKYQSFVGDGETASDTHRGTVPRQSRDKKEINQEDYTKKDSEESFSLFPVQTAPPAPRTKSADPPYSSEFEAFWRAYPRHNGSKKEAFKSYQQKIKQGATHDGIIAGARKYSAFTQSKGSGANYIKHAHRWLANECWAIDYAIDDAAGGNAVGNQGRSESGRYVDNARRIIEERTQRAARLAEVSD